MKLIHQIKKKNVLNKSITMNINISCLNFLPGTEISEQYYDKLEYNRLDGMSYYKEEKIEPVIENLVKNHKSIFLHCYNLHINTSLEQKYLGYFYMIVFNEVYFDFYDEIEEIFERYEYDYIKVYRDLFCRAKQDVIDLCDYVYGTYDVKNNIRNKKFKKLLKKRYSICNYFNKKREILL